MVGFKYLPVRVVTYLDGKVMAKVPQTPQLLQELGSSLGQMDRIFKEWQPVSDAKKR
jgi:Phosphotransferase enzyme family.